MMSKRQWLALFSVFMCYILFGASVFYMVENVEEEKKWFEEEKERHAIEELLNKYYVPNGENTLQDVIYKISNYCNKPLGKFEYVPDKNAGTQVTWTFYNSIFFIMTIVSTIGYGSLSPTTPFTRVFMIVFGIIGIPMNGIVILTLGDYFGKTFFKIYERWKISSVEHAMKTIGFIGQIALYTIAGFALFILTPSLLIMWYEGWTFDLAIEFAFATLTTVGIGKHVPGTAENGHGEIALVFYRMFLVIWLIIGLGYLAMVFGFITRGFRSKQMHQFERKLARNIKKTNRKIRRELRSILNEYMFMRVKPVYRERRTHISSMCVRTQSCPDLRACCLESSPKRAKKRAFSEYAPPSFALTRRQSDTDLSQIDKERTFVDESNSNELLIKVANALGNYDRTNSTTSSNFDPDTFQWSIIDDPKLRAISECDSEKEANFNFHDSYARMQEMREQEKYGRTRSRTLPPNSKTQNSTLQLKNRRRSSDVESQKCHESSDTVQWEFEAINQSLLEEQKRLADFLSILNFEISMPKSARAPRKRRLAITAKPPTRRASMFPVSKTAKSEERRFSICAPFMTKFKPDNFGRLESSSTINSDLGSFYFKS